MEVNIIYNDKIGQNNINKFGSKMEIIKYKNTNNIDVYFPEYNWTAKNVKYRHFKDRRLKCPYEPRVYGHGYIGEGKITINNNNKIILEYDVWHHMLRRCYDKKYQEKYSTYKGCKVCDEWLNFQNFYKWCKDNYYRVENERMCLDKDILIKGNKLYSPETCVFVPNRINVLFTKNDKTRGKYPIGVSYKNEKYQSTCSIYLNNKKKHIYLGVYNDPIKAFNVYKKYKENYIKQVADDYKDKIPENLYNAMYKYKVEITD